MDSAQFRKAGYAAIDQSASSRISSIDLPVDDARNCADSSSTKVVEYYDTIDSRRVMSAVKPGYLRHLLSAGVPQQGETWEQIQEDIEAKILPGLTHWCVHQSIPEK